MLNTQLPADQPHHVESVAAINPILVISGVCGDNALFQGFQQFDGQFDLLHGRDNLRVNVGYTVSYCGIEQITVQYAETSRVISNRLNPLSDGRKVCLIVADMKVGQNINPRIRPGRRIVRCYTKHRRLL